MRLTAALPSLRTIVSAAGKVSPGITMPISLHQAWSSIHGNNASANRIVKTHQFCAIGERCFYLYFRKHLSNALHHLIPPQHLTTVRHQFSNGFTVTCSLHYVIGDNRDAFGIVKRDASCEASSRYERSERDHKLVCFPWCEIHKDFFRSSWATNTTTSSVL